MGLSPGEAHLAPLLAGCRHRGRRFPGGCAAHGVAGRFSQADRQGHGPGRPGHHHLSGQRGPGAAGAGRCTGAGEEQPAGASRHGHRRAGRGPDRAAAGERRSLCTPADRPADERPQRGGDPASRTLAHRPRKGRSRGAGRSSPESRPGAGSGGLVRKGRLSLACLERQRPFRPRGDRCAAAAGGSGCRPGGVRPDRCGTPAQHLPALPGPPGHPPLGTGDHRWHHAGAGAARSWPLLPGTRRQAGQRGTAGLPAHGLITQGDQVRAPADHDPSVGSAELCSWSPSLDGQFFDPDWLLRVEAEEITPGFFYGEGQGELPVAGVLASLHHQVEVFRDEVHLHPHIAFHSKVQAVIARDEPAYRNEEIPSVRCGVPLQCLSIPLSGRSGGWLQGIEGTSLFHVVQQFEEFPHHARLVSRRREVPENMSPGCIPRIGEAEPATAFPFVAPGTDGVESDDGLGGGRAGARAKGNDGEQEKAPAVDQVNRHISRDDRRLGADRRHHGSPSGPAAARHRPASPRGSACEKGSRKAG